MESQLINLSLNHLLIEDFDNVLIQQLTIKLQTRFFSQTLKHPFFLSKVPKKDFYDQKLSIDFIYKSETFGSAFVKLSSFHHPFEILSINPVQISPEKERPHAESFFSNKKQIGKGVLALENIDDSIKTEFIDNTSELALDLVSIIQTHGNTKPKEAEHYRVLIIGLNSKLKTLCLVQHRLQTSEKDSLCHLKSREALEAELLKASNFTKTLKKQHLEELAKNINEKTNLSEKLKNLEFSYREKCIIENDLQSQILIQQGTIEQLTKENKNFLDMQNLIEKLKNNIKSLEVERDVFRVDFRKTIKNFESECENKNSEIEKIADKNLELEEKIIEKDKKINELSKICDKRKRKILIFQSKIEALNKEIIGFKDLEKKSVSMENLAKNHQIECVALQSQIQKMTQNFEFQVFSLTEEKNSLVDSKKLLETEIEKLKKSLFDKNSAYKSETIASQDLRTKNAILQQKLSKTLDSSKLFSQIKYLSTYSTEVTEKLIQDNDELSYQYLNNIEEYLNSLTLIKQIRDIIEDRDGEISLLRELIAELQSKSSYYPIKDDPVDEAIADYINSRSEPMQIQFIREDYGLYLFGTKRVFIKLENSKITSN